MYLAIDVGGTKTLVSEIKPKGEIISAEKFKTPKTYDAFLAKLADTVANLTTKDFKKACIALPGKIERSQGVGVSFGNLSWENVPIQHDLEQLTNCPVLVENDANLAGLGEAYLLKKPYDKVLYITVSTGIGSAFIVDGKLNPSTLDAEIGHMLLEHEGSLQRWEEFASGSAMVKKYGKRASEITDKRTWYVIAHNLATGFLTAIATYTPDVIIVGGGVGTHLHKFKDRLDELLKIYENPLLTVPPIVQAQNPEEAVIYGCYQLIKQDNHRPN